MHAPNFATSYVGPLKANHYVLVGLGFYITSGDDKLGALRNLAPVLAIVIRQS